MATLWRNRALRGAHVLVGLALGILATACASHGPSPRSLHYIDGDLVYSQPVHYRAYAAYLRARMAMEAQPADLDTAAGEVELALKIEPRDPHLWTTLAEVELRRGDREAALIASRTALQIRPEYAPAQQLLARLEGGEGSSAMSSRRGDAP
ncbi:MAG: hypothetical protein H6710_22200 [Myxococcales bacterium]|nr:hypothetical protein [Myxococcales bacterium]MCB9704051.1 hypothetical protein [Myxococcales bacterium]